ncbi:MAG: hypothetical protein ACJ8F7_08025 [Gemmataceae bacterium]
MFSLALSLALFVAGGPDDKPSTPASPPPKPHPLAPSLRETTEADENKFDAVINRFIEYDTGKLKGPDAKKALEDFLKLPPEAVFALVRGMNRAAAINDSCPALVIARRVASQVRSTRDRELVQYVRENAGAGVEKSRHMAIIKDLKVTCSQRQAALMNEKAPEIRGNTGP